MKFLFSICLIFLSTITFGQRWIVTKSDGTYITDSTGIPITGNATFLKNYVDANMQWEDTTYLTSTTVAPTVNSKFQIYQQDKIVGLDNIPVLPAFTTAKIQVIQSFISSDDKRWFIVRDRTKNKVAIFDKTTIGYITLTAN